MQAENPVAQAFRPEGVTGRWLGCIVRVAGKDLTPEGVSYSESGARPQRSTTEHNRAKHTRGAGECVESHMDK